MPVVRSEATHPLPSTPECVLTSILNRLTMSVVRHSGAREYRVDT
ncbi:hypothetical protein KGM_210003 [Danaus plexippus plexippus]|uniref:Uncharacterized protein n=1 Tax=Danaus plexippus plexippus TaxID=278856 RepID=A0A212EUJ0_DANPL|nr:hypothetical protein KGM_210003 [Danaus plexippus plexippus]